MIRHANPGDRGYVMVMFALLLVPLMMFTSLAIDVSSWYSRAIELQRSADAASLAGVIWMPDIAHAMNEATPVLERNGLVDGVDDITIEMTAGESGGSSFKVCVTDQSVPQFFAAVFSAPVKMTRCAVAAFNAPLQLGSPLNYFGGNHEALGTPGPVAPGRVGPTPSVFAFGSEMDQYCWVSSGGQVVGFWFRNNSLTPSDWHYQPHPANALVGDHPPCGTAAPLLPIDPATLSGGIEAFGCRVSGESARWERIGPGEFPTGYAYYNDGFGSGTCQYSISPIPPERSPKMWAAIQSYGWGHQSGDAYSTAGAEHRDTGYWYSVDIPESGVTGPLSIQVFDLVLHCATMPCASPVGDQGVSMQIRMAVYDAGPFQFDLSGATPMPGCDTGWVRNGTPQATQYVNRWAPVCTIASPSPGARYYINVIANDAATGKTDRGVTGYALRAVAGPYPPSCTAQMAPGHVACYGTGAQPRLSAYGAMVMFNRIDENEATKFFLAEVTPSFAGKTLEIDLFDPGDGTGDSWVSVIGPSIAGPEGVMIPDSACMVASRAYGDTNWSPVALSNGPDGTYPHTCTVQTSQGGNNEFQDRWLRFKIPIPSDYGTTGSEDWTRCDTAVADPTTQGGSCWWQISYYVKDGRLGDYTTWDARAENDPIHLLR